MPRGTAGVMKDLEDKQKRRRKRTQRGSLGLAVSALPCLIHISEATRLRRKLYAGFFF